MSRRTDLLQRLLKSNEIGSDKAKEQEFLATTAELILTDFINIAVTGALQKGAGTLVINLQNDTTEYMSGFDVEADLATAEAAGDDEVLKFLRQLLEQIDANDWSKNVLITLISDAGTKTFAVQAGGSQESFRAIAGEFSG